MSSADEMSDAELETWEAARRELGSAVTRYFSIVDPEVFVTAFVLVANKESVALERDNLSAVGVVTPEGQPWPLTTGMLVIASDSQRRDIAWKSGQDD